MTITTSVNVGGNYQATVTHKVEDGIVQTVTVGPQETRSFSAPHDKPQSIEISPERDLSKPAEAE